MAEHIKTDPDVPPPDPDLVARTIQSAIEKFRARKIYYALLGIAVLAVIVGVLILTSPASDDTPSTFGPMWTHATAARGKLIRDTSAAEELALLEGTLPAARGTPHEGLTLWLLGIYNYAEAYTTDKASFEERRPYLEKAAQYLKELEAERFDDLLLAKPQWFSSDRQAPVDVLHRQVVADLEWHRQHAKPEPVPDEDIVAVLRTAEGDIHLKFFRKLAPKHVENFITLATLGIYNGTQFHFVGGGNQDPDAILGGDPYTFFYPSALNKKHILRWGNGGLGYDLPPEDARFRIAHRAGIVTSQRIADADWDNAAQFRVMIKADRTLDRVHTPFAKVVEGMNVVEAIARKKTASESDLYRNDNDFTTASTSDLLVEPVQIYKIIVYKKGNALEHSFQLKEHEQSLATLKDARPAELPKDRLYAGRKLRDVDTAGEPRKGLDIPFPADVNPKAEPPPSPLGERKGP